MRKPIIAATVLLLATSVAGTPAHGQGTRYKWRDAQGRIQYSDRPPPAGTADKDILARPPGAQQSRVIQVLPVGQAPSAPAQPAAPAASTAVERMQAQERDKQTRESEAKLKAEEARNKQIRADNCKSAREQMASLRSGMRVARINDKGEREVLDDAQRNAQIQRTQEAINSNCN